MPAQGQDPTLPAAPNRLFRRYVLTLAGLVAVSVLTVGTTLAFYQYAQDLRRAHEVQLAEAGAGSASIDAYLRSIETVLRSLAQRLPEGTAAGPDVQATDFRNALKFQPAILNIRALDAQFREVNFVSRVDRDRIGSLSPRPDIGRLMTTCSAPVCYGTVFVRDQTEPYVTLGIHGASGGEFLAAEISVRFIDDVLARLTVGDAGHAYVVDVRGRLLAHPELRTLLRRGDLSSLPQVRDVTQAVVEGRPALPSVWGESPDGGRVFSSATRIQGPDWLLYVEQPAAEVLRTVWTTIGVTLAVLALGILAASLAAALFARRLTRPILELRDGAQRFGDGDLTARIQIRTRDEIESVATAFNGMADSLRALYESLESKVLERTRDLALANEQITDQARELAILNRRLGIQLHELNLKRDAADRASAAKSRFVAAASHDLRQPMHAVSLLVGILADRQISPEISSLLGNIQLSVSALENLFETLLDISRLDAGIVTPHPVCIGLDSLLRSVELTHRQAAADKGLTLRVHATRTCVYTDHALLFSMLGNLLSNAIRYTERGHVDVFCRKEDGAVGIYVSDSGVGVPEGELDRIFEEYYQLPDSGRGRGQGLGLGLSIVQKTADLLGYGLSKHSRTGVGSVFGIHLDVAPFAQFRRRPHAQSPALDSALAGAFVVIVDDDADSRFATEAIFQRWECHVLAGSDGESLRQALTQHLRQPDLIVADYRLRHGQTGLDVINALRQDAETRIPAVILTADHDLSLTETARLQGISMLRKPANAARIHGTVLEILQRSRVSDSQAVPSA